MASHIMETAGRGRANDHLIGGLLVTILILGSLLRFHNLDRKSIWYDEIVTLGIANSDNGLHSVIDASFHADFSTRSLVGAARPPVYYVISWLFLHLGDNDFVLRFPAALFGILGIAGTYCLGTVLFRRETGLLSAFLLSISPFHVRCSQGARYYTLFTFLSVLSVVCLYRSLKGINWQWHVAFVAVTILNLYTHHFALLLLLPQILFVVVFLAKRAVQSQRGIRQAIRENAISCSCIERPLILFPLAFIAILILCFPMIAQSLRYTHWVSPPAGEPTALQISVRPRVLLMVLALFAGDSVCSILLFLSVFIWGVLVSIRHHSEALVLSILCICVPCFALLLVPVTHEFRARYLIFLLPIYLVLISQGITTIGSKLTKMLPFAAVNKSHECLIGFLLTSTLFGLPVVPSIEAYYSETKSPWKELVIYLEAEAQSTDVILISADWQRIALLHYLPALENELSASESSLDIERACSRGRGVWYLGNARDILKAAWTLQDSSACSRVSFWVLQVAEGEENLVQLIGPQMYAPIGMLRAWP